MTSKSILICLSGLDTQEFIERAVRHISLDRHLTLLYVVDTRSAEELGYSAPRTPGKPILTPEHANLMQNAEFQTAAAILNEAGEQCMQVGFNAQNIRREVRKGRPEQQIIELARDVDANIGLIVIGSAYKWGPHITPGPANIGHVARSVVENSPCDVLLLR